MSSSWKVAASAVLLHRGVSVFVPLTQLINKEEFAAQLLACLKAWKDADFNTSQLGLETAFAGIPEHRLNLDGDALSIGHPVGASGARIGLHLLKTLQREGSSTGIASLCIGGGQGGTMLVQNPG